MIKKILKMKMKMKKLINRKVLETLRFIQLKTLVGQVVNSLHALIKILSRIKSKQLNQMT